MEAESRIAIESDADVVTARQRARELDGYTTGGGLGLGLPGARRLVDEFDIQSAPSRGTTVTLVMWGRNSSRSVRA